MNDFDWDKSFIIEEDDNIMIMPEFNDCLIGICERFGMNPVAAYDYDKIIEKLQDDLSYEDAVEHFQYNIIGAWVGDGTPVFVSFRDLYEYNNDDQLIKINKEL